MKNENWIVWLLAAVNFTNILDFMIMMPLGPQLRRVMSLDPAEWSFMVSSYTFAAFLSGILSIFFIDRFDRKKFLIFNFSGFAIATLLCGLAHTQIMLLLARSLAGVFGGVLGALVMAMIGDAIPLVRRSSAMGKVMAGFSAAAALGVPFGLYFGTRWGWQVPFIATAIISFITLIFIYFKIPSFTAHLVQPKKEKVLRKVQTIFTSRNKNLAFMFMSFLILGQFSIIPFLSPYMVANVGFLEEQLTLIYFFGGLCTVATSPIIGRLSDRHGNGKIFTIFLVLSLLPTVTITHLQATPVAYVIVVTSFFFLFAGGRMIPAMAIVLATAEPEIRGVFMSIRSAIQNLVAGIAAALAGAIMIENPDASFGNYDIVGYVAAAFSLLTLLLVKKIKLKF